MPFTVFGEDSAGSVEFSIFSVGMPFVFGKMPVIAVVNDGEFALSEWYAAEGISVADEAIGE
jgi:hypothetical protein